MTLHVQNMTLLETASNVCKLTTLSTGNASSLPLDMTNTAFHTPILIALIALLVTTFKTTDALKLIRIVSLSIIQVEFVLAAKEVYSQMAQYVFDIYIYLNNKIEAINAQVGICETI